MSVKVVNNFNLMELTFFNFMRPEFTLTPSEVISISKCFCCSRNSSQACKAYRTITSCNCSEYLAAGILAVPLIVGSTVHFRMLMAAVNRYSAKKWRN